mmetsp:Transcript_2475/g.3622  ORF Transcript_2475/g.3622 Transcript_2475/m.3622 type:complete len:207 (+) Transcript_2475:2651-3271(+)
MLSFKNIFHVRFLCVQKLIDPSKTNSCLNIIVDGRGQESQRAPQLIEQRQGSETLCGRQLFVQDLSVDQKSEQPDQCGNAFHQDHEQAQHEHIPLQIHNFVFPRFEYFVKEIFFPREEFYDSNALHGFIDNVHPTVTLLHQIKLILLQPAHDLSIDRQTYDQQPNAAERAQTQEIHQQSDGKGQAKYPRPHEHLEDTQIQNTLRIN